MGLPDLAVRTAAWIVLHSPLRWTMRGLDSRRRRWRVEVARDLLDTGGRILLGEGVLATHLVPDLDGMAVCGMPVRITTGGTPTEVTCGGCKRFLRSTRH